MVRNAAQRHPRRGGGDGRRISRKRVADITELVEQVTTFVASLHTFGLDAGKAEITWREVDEEDWAHGWKKYYKPLKVSDRLTIKPTWEPYQAES